MESRNPFELGLLWPRNLFRNRTNQNHKKHGNLDRPTAQTRIANTVRSFAKPKNE